MQNLDIMNSNKEHKKFLKKHYQTLIALGIPSRILDNPKKWLFFLQEGWDSEIGWHYAKEMMELQQIQLYHFVKEHHLQSCLANEIQKRYNL
ncbi:hypothetical protein MHTCC0001_31790 [Flavobacteriaceae bacterium MHTCC 0001]